MTKEVSRELALFCCIVAQEDIFNGSILQTFDRIYYAGEKFLEEYPDDSVWKEECYETTVVEFAKKYKENLRRCSVTGNVIRSGYVWRGCVYFDKESDLIAHIRSLNDPTEAGLTDAQLIRKSYSEGYHYWTEWEDETLDSN